MKIQVLFKQNRTFEQFMESNHLVLLIDRLPCGDYVTWIKNLRHGFHRKSKEVEEFSNRFTRAADEYASLQKLIAWLTNQGALAITGRYFIRPPERLIAPTELAYKDMIQKGNKNNDRPTA